MPDVHWGYGFPIGGVAATDVAAGGVVSPGRGRVRHLLRRAAARRRPRPRRAAPTARRADGRAGRGDPARAWAGARCGSCPAARAGRGAGRRLPVRRGAGATACSGTSTAARTTGRSPTPIPAQVSERAVGARPGAGRQPGLGQPLPGGAGGRGGVRRAGRRQGVRAAAGPGLRDDPLRLARAGPPDLHRPRAGDGEGDAPVRHRGAGPAAGLRPGLAPPRGGRTWARWPPPPTTRGPTGSCSAEAARRVFGRVTGTPAWTWSTTSRTTSRRWRRTRWTGGSGGCACTARAPPGRCRPATRTCRTTCATVGQPVLIPGSMGTASYVLTGVPGAPAFASTCHGAGRVHSRHQAARSVRGRGAARAAGGGGDRGARRVLARPGRGDAGGVQGRHRGGGRRPRAPGCAGRWPGWCRWAWSRAEPRRTTPCRKRSWRGSRTGPRAGVDVHRHRAGPAGLVRREPQLV